MGSRVRLFADDTILYRQIRYLHDELALQDYFRLPEDWEQNCIMEFHLSAKSDPAL